MARGRGLLIRKALEFLRKTVRRARRRPAPRHGPPKPTGGFEARPISRDRHGFLTDGRYRVNSRENLKHTHGQALAGKSSFYPGTDVDRLTLEAAQRADSANLWNLKEGTKARVTFDDHIGTHGETGRPTNVVNVYRRKSRTIHASPGSPVD
ncbi:hypothetical protein [Asanoa siamensis]|uniref:Uncharacterized protein n=1 Tax=Asanoa siamensis TaxID=926357 RepID=A0ABQ4CH15_9ACTN|nr:hypothetical protein [Asanoa siamensis]GIF70575.1 hypothetical protein Asi02nite_00930 [Asanoa siamensis]